MNSKLKINDFKEELDNEEYSKIYENIAIKAIEFAQEICKERNVKFIYSDEELKSKLYGILYTFENYIYACKSIRYVADNLLDELYVEKEYYIMSNDLENVERIINHYNRSIDEFEDYKTLKMQINEIGFKTLEEEHKTKLINLFKEMLDFKHKNYKEDDSFADLCKKVDIYYNIYHSIFENCFKAVYSRTVNGKNEDRESVELDETEVIMVLKDTYEYLTYEDDDYTKYADFYIDIDLEDGQTLDYVYKELQDRFENLFKEMLDYKKVEYDKKETSYKKLTDLICKYYPYYKSSLNNYYFYSDKATYVQLIDYSQRLYNKMSKDYKKHSNDNIDEEI